jgi:tetratricopeptide (TPR) repeat protein
VRDSAGAALEGVKVTLSDESGFLLATATTSSTGVYTFDGIKAGKYEIRAERKGFHPAIPVIIDLRVQQKARVDLALQPLPDPTAGHTGETDDQGQTNNTVGYYQTSSLKADEVVGAVDPAGYSSPADADTTIRLLEGATALRQDSSARPDSKAEEVADAANPSHGLIEAERKSAAAKNPQDFGAIHDLGKFYLGNGQPEKAILYLAEAYRINPSDQPNAYALAVANLRTGNLSAARQQVQALLNGSDNAEFHTLFAEIEDKAANFEGAVREHQHAAQIEPSEQNIFAWGSELLTQRNIAAALDVFKSGMERYPKSPDMLIGHGIALYLRGDIDDAVRSLTQATDLNPTAYRPYVFLADVSNASQKESAAVAERLKRFAEIHPQDARAVFYYAMSLWRGSRGSQEGLEEVAALLKKSSALDPKFPDAHLQLGNLYASQNDYPEAIDQYQQAIEFDPESAAIHYKLGQAFARTGHHEQAGQEFELYERLHHQSGAARANDQGKEQQLINLVKENANPAP